MPLDAKDVAVLDRNAQALGVPVARLMANAGAAVAQAVADRYPGGRVLVLAGPGNNGGDGAVAATRLKQAGRDVRLLYTASVKRVRTPETKAAMDAAVEAGVRVDRLDGVDLGEECAAAGVVVDAVLGVGVRGELRAEVRAMVEAVTASGRSVVAVDVPTGYLTESPLVARCTVTFHDRKVGMRDEVCGEIVVADIGIPAEAATHVGPGDLVVRYPRTRGDMRKGDMGKLLILGGGPYTGAPVLAGMGAFATGTDMVHMVLPGDAARVAQAHLLEAIVHGVAGQRFGRSHGPLAESLMEEADVLLVGPGLGRDPDTLSGVRDVVSVAARSGKRCVVDGDAFSAFKDDAGPVQGAGFVLTPHAGEMRVLAGADVPGPMQERVRFVRDWLGGKEAVVLLKGQKDLIVTKDAHSVNAVHDPVMTTAGTGDVLAGVVAALLGRGMEPFHAARVAAFLNGSAGVRARRDLGHGVRARDVARRIPAVLAEHFGAPGG